jgi:hypothetical protein
MNKTTTPEPTFDPYATLSMTLPSGDKIMIRWIHSNGPDRPTPYGPYVYARHSSIQQGRLVRAWVPLKVGTVGFNAVLKRAAKLNPHRAPELLTRG